MVIENGCEIQPHDGRVMEIVKVDEPVEMLAVLELTLSPDMERETQQSRPGWVTHNLFK